MVERGEKQTPRVFLLTHWKSLQMNIMMLWRLQRDSASCDKRTCQGELQHAWLTNSAHYPVCSLLSVMRTGIGAKGSVRPSKTSGRGGGEASTNSMPQGKERREQPENVTVTKRHELCHSVLAGIEMGGHLLGRGGGPPWLRMVWRGNGAGLAACSHTSHFSGLIRLH